MRILTNHPQFKLLEAYLIKQAKQLSIDNLEVVLLSKFYELIDYLESLRLPPAPAIFDLLISTEKANHLLAFEFIKLRGQRRLLSNYLLALSNYFVAFYDAIINSPFFGMKYPDSPAKKRPKRMRFEKALWNIHPFSVIASDEYHKFIHSEKFNKVLEIKFNKYVSNNGKKHGNILMFNVTRINYNSNLESCNLQQITTSNFTLNPKAKGYLATAKQRIERVVAKMYKIARIAKLRNGKRRADVIKWDLVDWGFWSAFDRLSVIDKKYHFSF